MFYIFREGVQQEREKQKIRKLLLVIKTIIS